MIFHDVSSFHGEAGGRPQVVPALMEVFGIPLALAAVQAGRRAATAHLADVLWRSPTFSNKSLEILGYFWSMDEYGTLRTSAAHLGIDRTSDIRL